jgi:hypothetical protein
MVQASSAIGGGSGTFEPCWLVGGVSMAPSRSRAEADKGLRGGAGNHLRATCSSRSSSSRRSTPLLFMTRPVKGSSISSASRASQHHPSRVAVSSAGSRHRPRQCRCVHIPAGCARRLLGVSDTPNVRLNANAAPSIAPNLAHRLVQVGRRCRFASDAVLTGPQMSMAAISAPLSAISTAIARPMPRAGPVTTANFPRSSVPRPALIGPELWALPAER